MINTATHGKNILNALFNTSKKSSSANTVAFSNTPYLALFAQMPGADGTGYVEVTASDYARVLVTNTGAYGKQMFGAATVEAGTGRFDGKNIAVVKNQDLIAFPEAATASFGQIVGFGIMDTATVGSGTPSYWGLLGAYDESTGEFVASPVTIEQGEIPIFRVGDFKCIFC